MENRWRGKFIWSSTVQTYAKSLYVTILSNSIPETTYLILDPNFLLIARKFLF